MPDVDAAAAPQSRLRCNRKLAAGLEWFISFAEVRANVDSMIPPPKYLHLIFIYDRYTINRV
jgi:hypothetical protein